MSAVPERANPPSPILDARRLLVSTLVVLLLLVGTVAALGYFFREPLRIVARLFVETLGGPGIAVGYFLPDAFTIPLPNDVFTLLGLEGGMSFWDCVAWATLGSLAGGSAGYAIGRRLRDTALIARAFERRAFGVQELLDRYGLVAVAVAAITPLPYSIFCWAAGAGRLPFGRFFLVSLLRLVRVAGYLYLIQLGLLAGS
jgi:membrane protein YqaA with SNARE-associated domain